MKVPSMRPGGNLTDLEKLKILHDDAVRITVEHRKLLGLTYPGSSCVYYDALANNPRQ